MFVQAGRMTETDVAEWQNPTFKEPPSVLYFVLTIAAIYKVSLSKHFVLEWSGEGLE